MGQFKELLSKVKAFAFDVDGVYSKSNFLLHTDGDYIRSMDIKDGFATQLAIKKNYPIAIITGGNSESVKKRFNDLGVTDVYLASSYKFDDFEDYMYKYGLNADEILYMGDDLPDYEVLKAVGIPTCPADAAPEIKEISAYISAYKGGEGCVRDVIEQVLKAQEKWMSEDALKW